MAALIPMCGARSLRQIFSLTGAQLSSNIDIFNILHQNTVKSLNFRSKLNHPCKCWHSTAPVRNETAESESVNSSDDTKDKKEEKKAPFVKKYGKTIFWSSAVIGSFTLGMLIKRWGAPLEDPEGNVIKDEFSDDFVILAYIRRAYKEVFREVEVTQRPSRDKLLPDPLTYPYIQPKYTLVLEMTDVLVHPEWTYGTGWRFKKRPGIDQFLKAIGPPVFEVVIFTQDSGFTADPIITKIDPENYIMYRLYRDATHFMNGCHKKDLNYLNRDLSKVIMIDWNPEAVSINRENSFLLKQWTGEDKDTILGELAEFLRAIAALQVDDVRPVLEYYRQFDNPLQQFRENQRKLKEEQDRQHQLQKDAEQNRLAKGFTWTELLRR